MLTRIYGTAWPEAWQLKEHKGRMEEAKKRDHRLLGKKLDLFSYPRASRRWLVFLAPGGARAYAGLMEQTRKDLHEKGVMNRCTRRTSRTWSSGRRAATSTFMRDGMFDQMDVVTCVEIKLRRHQRGRASARWRGDSTPSTRRPRDQMDFHTQVEKEQYQLKPMNCPFHCLVFKDQLRSYRRSTLQVGGARYGL